MPTDIKKILDELGASGDDRAVLEQHFGKNETLASKLNEWRENGLRQSDYSRRMAGLDATESAKRAELEAEEKRLTQAREGMNAQFLQAQKDREAAEVAAASMAAKVKRLAAEWNIPEASVKDILDGAPAPVAAPPQSAPGPVNFDASKFVSREEYQRLQEVALRMPALATKLPGMRAQHQQLFKDCPPDFEEKLLAEATKQQRPIDVVWDNLYGVNEKRQALLEAEIRQDERAKAESEFKAKYSASAASAMPLRPENDSPIFKLDPLNKTAPRPGVHGPAGAASSVQNAVQAFSQGKYRRPEFAHQE